MKRHCRGQAVPFFLLLLPLLWLLLWVLADVAVLVVTRLRLQRTADRAALAAADRLAETMNTLAEKNWEIHREYLLQQREFAQADVQDDAGGQDQLRARQADIDERRDAMQSLVEEGYARACEAAQEVVRDATAWATLLPMSGGAHVTDPVQPTCVATEPLFHFGDDAVEEAQWGTLAYRFPDGGDGWFDPGSVEGGGGTLLRYRVKPEGDAQQVAFAVRLRVVRPWSYTPRWFGADPVSDEPPWVEATAAAQPFGGSLREAALTEAEELDALEAAPPGEDGPYTATLVPLESLRATERGYRGLRYRDPDRGWLTDVDTYLH